MIAPFPDNFRTQLLRAEIMRARDDCGGLRALLDAMRHTLLAETRRKIAGIAPGAVVGWGREGDRDAFIQVLADVDPGLDTRILTQTGEAVWPDIGGYPDLAPEVAWLSYVFGEIAAMENGDSAARQITRAPSRYPGRLETISRRDEYWFWMRDSSPNPGAPDGRSPPPTEAEQASSRTGKSRRSAHLAHSISTPAPAGALAERIGYLLRHRHEKLLTALYILDIGETAYNRAMEQDTMEDRAWALKGGGHDRNRKSACAKSTPGYTGGKLE